MFQVRFHGRGGHTGGAAMEKAVEYAGGQAA
jgi:hypothetical protein